MNLRLELTEECSRCHGMGWSHKDLFNHPADTTRIPCEGCRHTGQVPTWQGIELLNFINTYKDWMEDD